MDDGLYMCILSLVLFIIVVVVVVVKVGVAIPALLLGPLFYIQVGGAIGACRPGHTWALPGLFHILISQGPDAKTHGMLPDPYI